MFHQIAKQTRHLLQINNDFKFASGDEMNIVVDCAMTYTPPITKKKPLTVIDNLQIGAENNDEWTLYGHNIEPSEHQ